VSGQGKDDRSRQYEDEKLDGMMARNLRRCSDLRE